jgi:C1A family cysteine protease
MSITIDGTGLGWLPDYPDFRDYTPEHEEIKSLLAKVKVKAGGPAKTVKFATSQDLRAWCSPIENQLSIGSCTAQAGVGLVEYFERRAFGKHMNASRLFLYKVTRNLLNWTGDTGAFLRTTMGAMAVFGVPPEDYWRYVIADYDVEPSAFCYSFAQSYQANRYYRLDPPGTNKAALLNRIKYYINAKFPSMFGFTVYNSIRQANTNGEIPYPIPGDKAVGGHAIVAVGYDNSKVIWNRHPFRPDKKTKGALLIRNSWGTGWGDQGYGWLPYDYVLKGLATDWWSLIRNEWMDTKQFGL